MSRMLPPQLANDAAWKLRFRAPQLLAVHIAEADPTRTLAAANASNDPTFQLYSIDLATGETRPLTAEPDGQAQGHLWPDGRWACYLLDEDGSEVGHYVRVPFEGGPAQDLTPDLPAYSSFDRATSRDGRVFGFVAGDPQGSVVYAVGLGTDGSVGAAREVWHTDRLVFGITLSADGSVVVVAANERSEHLDFNLVAVDVASGERLGDLWDGEGTSVEPVRCSPVVGDLRTLAVSNRSGELRPLLWDPRTGERVDVDVDGLTGEVRPLDWSADGERIVLLRSERAEQQLFVARPAEGSVVALADRGGSFGVDGSARFGADGAVLALWQSSTHAPQLVELGEDGGVRTVLPPAEVPAGRPFRSVVFPSSDGTQVQMWVAVPDGDGPFPLILETHGGPQEAMLDLFWPLGQIWLDHGFAFCSVNYRGSTGFGREFERAIWGDLGHREVQDMVAARELLVQEGIADPERVLLTGWSYGGYLTLMALGAAPEHWAGGMAGIAIAGWTGMYEDSSDVLREYLRGIMGGTPDEVPERYRASSPVTYLQQVRAPVLIVQGRNDSRCPAGQIERYEVRAKELGKEVEVLWFDSGHAGWTDTEATIGHLEEMLRFAFRVLEGGPE